MKSRQLALASSLLLLSTMAKAEEAKNSGIVLAPAKLIISVEVDGKPSNIQCRPDIGTTLCPLLVRSVSTWRFVPGTRANVATVMDVEMSLSLAAVEKADGYGVRASRASLMPLTPRMRSKFLLSEDRSFTPPRYPLRDQMAGRWGLVMLELLLQPDSDVPQIGRMWFNGKPANERTAMVKAAVDAANSWPIDHVPEQLSHCMPIAFAIDEQPKLANGTEPCKSTYVEGFAPPTLITDATSASF
jgi:hypothetical protein